MRNTVAEPWLESEKHIPIHTALQRMKPKTSLEDPAVRQLSTLTSFNSKLGGAGGVKAENYGLGQGPGYEKFTLTL